jgi:hypothetical protein
MLDIYFWDRIVGDENDEASRIAAEQMDLSKLVPCSPKCQGYQMACNRPHWPIVLNLIELGKG